MDGFGRLTIKDINKAIIKLTLGKSVKRTFNELSKTVNVLKNERCFTYNNQTNKFKNLETLKY